MSGGGFSRAERFVSSGGHSVLENPFDAKTGREIVEQVASGESEARS